MKNRKSLLSLYSEKQFNLETLTAHTHATILLMTYVFFNIQINLTMTSQRTNHLNDTVGVVIFIDHQMAQ